MNVSKVTLPLAATEEEQPKQTLSPTRSLYELAMRSPGAAISSIAALFIVIILCITIPSLFATHTISC